MQLRLLFICTHNRCRSILAEAIGRHVCPDLFELASAGSQPAGNVHPLTLKALEQHNVTIDGLKSKSWDELNDFRPDAVLTMCDNAAKESCPTWFGDSVRVNWSLSDPSKTQGSEQDMLDAMHQTIETLTCRFTLLANNDLQSATATELKELLEMAAS
jgi:arsenate reductase